MAAKIQQQTGRNLFPDEIKQLSPSLTKQDSVEQV
jgi:hypothetical protein